jgi:death-on-curing family protein
MQKGEIQIFTTKSGIDIRVNLDKESVWLDAHLLATLFGVNRPAVVKHINNIFNSNELDKNTTCSILEQVAADGKTRKMNLYNLDVIISVGYRVNSVDATQFRKWATEQLKKLLIQGYTINQKRLDELQKTIQLIASSNESLNLNETKGLLSIINNYTKSFVLLNQFDSNRLEADYLSHNITYEINYEEAVLAISELKNKLIKEGEATSVFGNQKDNSFKGLLGNVVQTFDGNYLYPSIEEQAANLLYFVIKNHPFSDGNKRIGAFMFIWFLDKNQHQLKKSGELKINDNALVALSLLIAQSSPNDKELMILLIINLITNK